MRCPWLGSFLVPVHDPPCPELASQLLPLLPFGASGWFCQRAPRTSSSSSFELSFNLRFSNPKLEVSLFIFFALKARGSVCWPSIRNTFPGSRRVSAAAVGASLALSWLVLALLSNCFAFLLTRPVGTEQRVADVLLTAFKRREEKREKRRKKNHWSTLESIQISFQMLKFVYKRGN